MLKINFTICLSLLLLTTWSYRSFADTVPADSEDNSDSASVLSPLNQHYASGADNNSSPIDPEFDTANDITADNLDAN